MKTKTELKPCPFCGGKPFLSGIKVFWVVCENCLGSAANADSREGAINRWNRRAKS